MTLSWNDLRIIPALADAGSVAAAARGMGLDASTLSRRLAALEEALGTRLFERTPTGLLVTDAGRIAIATARNIEAACDEMVASLSNRDQELAGEVKVTGTEGFAPFVVGILSDLRDSLPAIHVDFIAETRPVDLFRREVDIAVRAYREVHGDLVVRSLGDVGWALFAHSRYVARRGMPESITALKDHDIIGFDEALSRMAGAQWIAEHVEPRQVVFRGNSTHSAVVATEAGVGIGVLPAFMLSRMPDIQRIGSEVVARSEIFLVYTVEARRLARVQAVAERIVEGFASARELLAGLR